MRISERALNGRICLKCRKKALRENANFAERSETGRIILSSKTKKINRVHYYFPDKDYIPLSKSHPHFAKQWHPVKNGEFKPFGCHIYLAKTCRAIVQSDTWRSSLVKVTASGRHDIVGTVRFSRSAD